MGENWQVWIVLNLPALIIQHDTFSLIFFVRGGETDKKMKFCIKNTKIHPAKKVFEHLR